MSSGQCKANCQFAFRSTSSQATAQTNSLLYEERYSTGPLDLEKESFQCYKHAVSGETPDAADNAFVVSVSHLQSQHEINY